MAVGTWYALAWGLAEEMEARGFPIAGAKRINLGSLREAASMFPFDIHLRDEPAYMMIQVSNMIPAKYVVAEINSVLPGDPFRYDLLYDRAVLGRKM